MRIVGVVVLSALLPLVVTAQQVPTEFPPGAQEVASDVLRGRIAGKTLRGTLADGQTWRLEYKESGYMFVDTSRGFRDTGKWRVEGGKLCSELPRGGTGCSETRVDDKRVYIKRASTGEVVALEER